MIQRAQSFLDYYHFLLGQSGPQPAWIDADAISQISAAVSSVRETMAAEEQAAAKARRVFVDGALDLDVENLLDRFERNTSFFRKWTREYRTDRALLDDVGNEGVQAKPSDLLLLSEWKATSAQRHEAETILRGWMGPLFDAPTADWDEIDSAIESTSYLIESNLIADRTKLASQLGRRGSHRGLLAAAEQVNDSLEAWRALSERVPSPLPLYISAGPFDGAARWLRDADSKVARVLEFVARFESRMPTDAPLSQYRNAALTRRSLHAAETSLADFLSSSAGAWPTRFESPAEISEGDMHESERTLAWTLDLRSAAAKLTSRDASTLPELTPAQLEALSSSPFPQALRQVHERWMSAHDRILAYFDVRRHKVLFDELTQISSARALLTEMNEDTDGPTAWADAQRARDGLTELGFSNVLSHALQNDPDGSDLEGLLVHAALRLWVEHHLHTDDRLQAFPIWDLDGTAERFRELDRELVSGAVGSIVTAAAARRPTATYGQSSIIRREAEKKRRHISVRDLMDRARDAIQAIHPCFMMSPLAVSQYLPSDLTFDVVIFDEASQVTPGDAINCIYRGSSLIAAGDQRQLPPTSFFMSSQIDEDSEDEDLAADYESILDLMKSSGNFNTMTLRWHYRSRHEHLIAYSNSSFYESRLVTFPGAVHESVDMGVKLLPVQGVYRRSAGQDNPIEAKATADRVLHHFETRPGKSLGVVAFSAAQRDAIEDALSLARAARPELDVHFEDDRVDGFFVKSLEYVQGDERDVMIFSIGYGPDEQGRIYKNFGALNRSGGERRLNVAITRARELVEVVSSMSASQLGDVHNEGARHLRRYLDFAERGPDALTMELGSAGLGTDSPFEDSVIDVIRGWGFDVQPQVGVAGYRIDIGVKHPNHPGTFMLGVECDGAMYHSSKSARDRDRLRHEVLEGLGWSIHHIWGTAWYRNRDHEKNKLRALLEEMSKQPAHGRLASKAPIEPIELAFESGLGTHARSWTVPYRKAEVNSLNKWVDPSDSANVRRIAKWVEEIADVEAPVHLEVITGRLRNETGAGRVGSRILANLVESIKRSNVSLDGQFLILPQRDVKHVRIPSEAGSRAMEHVHDLELSLAIRCALQDAGGASRTQLTTGVCSVFGWQRQSGAMTERFDTLIDRLVMSNHIDETPTGLRIRQGTD